MGQPCDITGRVLRLGVDYIGGFILFAGRHQGLSIQKDLNQWFFFGIEPKGKLVESRRHTDDATLVLFPQEVVRACIDGLHLPWHLVLVVKVTALPDPAAHAILGAKGLVY